MEAYEVNDPALRRHILLGLAQLGGLGSRPSAGAPTASHAFSGLGLELLDTCLRQPPEAMSLWTELPSSELSKEGAPLPRAALAVAWGAGPLGLSHELTLLAQAVSPLEALLAALPRGRGNYSIRCPLFAASALESRFRVEIVGPEARYLFVDPPPHAPAAAQATPLPEEDLEVLAFAFPRLVPEAPKLALIFADQLHAVALTTHLAEGFARIGLHVPEEHRGRGFGTGVATALILALQAQGLTPMAEVAMANEAALRLCEGLGGRLSEVHLRLNLHGRRLD